MRRPTVPRPARAAALLAAAAALLLAAAAGGCGGGPAEPVTIGAASRAAAPAAADTPTTAPIPRAPSAPTVRPAPVPTAEPTPSPAPSPGASPSPAATADPSASPTTTPAATPEPTPAATPEPTPSPTPEPTPTPDPDPPTLTRTPPNVAAGETLLVVARPGSLAGAAAAAAIEFRGESRRMLAGDGVFWDLLAVPIDADDRTGSVAVTILDAGGAALRTLRDEFAIVRIERPIDRIEVPTEQESLLGPEPGREEAEIRRAQFAPSGAAPAWTGKFARPVDGPVSAPFGVGRSYDGGPVNSHHSGTDYAGETGEPVRAAGPGRVVWTGAMPIRGNTVIVDHGGGVRTGYHHLDRIGVAVGDAVETGDTLGDLGSTGLSTGPHLHWELLVHGVNVNPETWLSRTFLP